MYDAGRYDTSTSKYDKGEQHKNNNSGRSVRGSIGQPCSRRPACPSRKEQGGGRDVCLVII